MITKGIIVPAVILLTILSPHSSQIRATSAAAFPHPNFNDYSQRFSSSALDQRLCVSLATTFDFLAHSLSTILHRHLRFYDHPRRYTAVSHDLPRFYEIQNGVQTFEDIDIVFDAPYKPEIGRIVVEEG